MNWLELLSYAFGAVSALAASLLAIRFSKRHRKQYPVFRTLHQRQLLIGSIAVGSLAIAVALGIVERLRTKTSGEPLTFGTADDLRVSYYYLEGPFLLASALRGYGFSEKDGFSSKPFWLVNDVYKQVREILNLNPRPSSDVNYDDLFLQVISKGQTVSGKHISSGAGKDVDEAPFVGASNFRGPNFVATEIDSIIDRVGHDTHWTMTFTPWAQSTSGPSLRWGDVSFVGLPEAVELRPWIRDPVTRRIIDRYPDRRDLVLVRVRASHGGYQMEALIRQLKLLVLDIENLGRSPVRLRSVSGRLAKGPDWTQLRGAKELGASIDSTSPVDVNIPVGSLAPGEHVFVPLQLDYGIMSSITTEFGDANWERCLQEKDLPAPFPLRGPLVLEKLIRMNGARQANAEFAGVPIDATGLASKIDLREAFERDYALGSVFRAESISVANPDGSITKAVREFDRTNLIARGTWAKGSCPILSIRSANRLQRIRPILVEAVTSTYEQTDRVPLDSFPDEVVISEEEPETSFIRSVKLMIRGCGPSMTLEGALPTTGNSHVAIRRGEQIAVRFEREKTSLGGCSLELHVTGFYIPDALSRR